jgi:hypothetical protein
MGPFEGKPDSFKEDMLALMEEVPGHFTQGEFNFEELTGSDRAIWEEVKNETLTKEEFAEYVGEVMDHGNPTRHTYLAMVRNRLTGIWLQKEIDARKKK